MNNSSKIVDIVKNHPGAGVAFGLVVILIIVLLWPDAPNEPGVGTKLTTSAESGTMHDHESHSVMQSPDPHAGHRNLLENEPQVWSCSMHPQIQREGPGQCPICGMDLVPVRKRPASENQTARMLQVTQVQRALMKIETAPVERRFPSAELRLVGKVTYDETRLAYITARVPGRIDDLFVDYTGVSVKEGDHMVELYSPELLSAQEELLQALSGLSELSKSSVQSLRASARGTVESARDKLRLWGLTAAQIEELERSGQASEKVTIYSPASGVVIHRNAQEGMYVGTGTKIFTIADLNDVWVQLDAYESDLQWLRYGQPVSFTTEAFPGETFEGVVSFIDPVLDATTRTVKVRVNVENEKGWLKPEMFVRAKVTAQFASHGQVLDPNLGGKWVSPMHPEIIKDAPGKCDVCGMDLVPAETLGQTSASHIHAPLVIPATAPLLTGTRAVVYVEVEDASGPTYVGREVVLGPRAGEVYIVESGLTEGELVVTSGNFKIDSALQIQAKPSMMNPEGGHSGGGHDHGGR